MLRVGRSARSLVVDSTALGYIPKAPPVARQRLAMSSAAAASSTTATAPSSLAVSGDRPEATKAEEPVQFVPLSRSVHVYRPEKGKKSSPSSNKATSSSSILSPVKTDVKPSAIVIMGWMDAPLRIVTKYAAPYATLFPQATIVIKLSTGMAFVAKKEARHAALAKVIEVLEEVQASSEARSQLHGQVQELEKSAKQAGLRMDVDSQNKFQTEAEEGKDDEKDKKRKASISEPKDGILIHSFSDGGAHNLSQLLELFEGRNVPAARAMIFDCSPGRASPQSGSTAFTIPLAKRPILRAIAKGIIYIYLSMLYMLRRILGTKTWSQILRSKLNDPLLWKWQKKASVAAATEAATATSPGAFPPRLYLYSKADKLIDWRAVEEHAQDAAKVQGLEAPLKVEKLSSANKSKAGNVVALRRWESANHCDLGRADFDGYWTAVRSFLQAVL